MTSKGVRKQLIPFDEGMQEGGFLNLGANSKVKGKQYMQMNRWKMVEALG